MAQLAKKLAKMTEEERAIFLEQQKQQEEEAQKKKEEMLLRYLKEKLAKEEKASKVNLVKLRNQWRSIMRKAKSEELNKDLEVMSQRFERIVDRKDAIIQSLAQDLEEAEEQYQISLQCHLHKVDGLMDYQAKRIKNLEEGYRNELSVLREEYNAERRLIVARHDQQMKELSDVKYAMDLRYDERETDAAHTFQSRMDELQNKHLEDTHTLSAHRKATLDELWLEFQKETKQYKDNTEERKLRFEALKKKDEDSSNTIARQMRRLHKLQETITALKHKMVSNAKESEEKTGAIKQDREAVLAHFRTLKVEMNSFREAERSTLTKLTIQSDTAIKQLQKKREKGECILKLTEMCRKLETEEEKVLPFYSSSLSHEEEGQAESIETEPPSESLAKVMHEYSSLQNFWKRYNKVLLDKLSLDREKKILNDENSKLKMLLKQYLDGISVNDDILNQSNSLFIVNKRSNPPLYNVPVGDPRIQRTKPSLTVVEAAHVAKNIIN